MGKFEKNTPKAAPRAQRPRQSAPSGRFAAQKKPSKKKNPWPLYVGIGAAALLLCVCGYFFFTTVLGMGGAGSSQLEQNHIVKNAYVAGVNIGGLTREEAMQKLRGQFETVKTSGDSKREVLTFGDKMQNLEIKFYGSDPVATLFTTTYDPTAENEDELDLDIFGEPEETTESTESTSEPTEATEPTEEKPDPHAPEGKILDRKLVLPASDIKITFDLQDVVEAAYQYGRKTRLPKTDDKRINVDISKHLVITDNGYIDDVLTNLSEEMTEGAATEIRHDDSRIEITLGSIGRSFDMKELKDAIKRTYMLCEFELIFEYEEVIPDAFDLDKLYKDYKCVAPVNAKLDKETFEITESKNGFGFTMSEAYALLSAAKPGDVVTLFLTELEPKYSTEFFEEKLFKDVLATYDSPHVWNPVRTHNLELAAAAIDGTILLPGDIFSFNKIVGERTAEKGYGAAAVYVGGKTEDQLGGGVCQVASTIYWCTLKADLEVIERYEHQFTPSYVPWGMDATIYWGSLDYQFRNNTKFPIRIDASVSDGYVHITLVGTETKDYTVDLFYEVVSSDHSETKTIYIHPDMSKYSEYSDYDHGETIQTAYDGYVVNTYLKRIDKDGNVISTDRVNVSEYDRRDKEVAYLLDPTIPMNQQIDSDGNLIEQDPTEEPTEPSTEPTEPTEPTTEPTEPTTEPTEPSEEPTEPPTPTEPPENSGPGTITPGG